MEKRSVVDYSSMGTGSGFVPTHFVGLLESGMDTLNSLDTTALPASSALIPLVGVGVLVLVSLLHARGLYTRGSGASFWWRRLPKPAAGLFGLLFLVVWCLLSLVFSTCAQLAAAVAVLLACGLVADARRQGGNRVPQAEHGTAGHTASWHVTGIFSVPRDVLVLAAASVLACLALELPWNPGILTSLPTFWWMELGLIATTIVALYFLGRRRGTLPAVGVAVFMVIGFIQYYVALFRGTAIMPSDIYSVGTAMAVGGSYSYVLQGSALASICCAVVAMTLLGFVRQPRSAGGGAAAVPPNASGKAAGANSVEDFEGKSSPRPSHAGHRPRTKRSKRSVVACTAVGVALLLGLVGIVRGVAFADFGVEVEYFFTLDKYREQGILPSFIATAQDMPIKEPAGYTSAAARQLEADYVTEASDRSSYDERQEQFDQVRPTVIAVMNETFSDLSIYRGIADAGYDGPQYYNGISDALERGTLYVSAYGGGTCNTEFEFLTSTSMASVGAGKYPYVQYDLSNIGSIAHQFKVLGYSTSAIHPNKAANWSRDEVYVAMDFDSFYSIDAFEDAPTFHSGVTDRATYDKILDLLSQNDAPQFIFDVTMQNHSGYDQGNIPEGLLTSYEPEGVSATTNAKLNEYLSCIEASDRDLAYFMGKLRGLDRPVVLVFFGDHQPNITTPYNDAYYPNETEVEHAERAYQTTYFVWANYDVTENAQQSERVDTSTNYLGSLLMNSIGAPMSEHQEAQLALRESIPAVNLYGYLGADGNWYALGEASPFADAYSDGLWMGYLNFGEVVL